MLLNNNLTALQLMQLQQQAAKQQAIAAAMAMQGVPMNGLTPEQAMIQNQMRKEPKTTEGIFIALQVTNNNPTNEEVVLFDATGSYALKNGYNLPPGVTIECLTYNGGGSAGYQSLVNDIATGTVLYFDAMSLEASNQAQFSIGLDMYADNPKTSGSTLFDTIYPSRGRNSMQQQLQIQDIAYSFKINRRSAMVYNQLANSIFQIRMFCRVEYAVAL
jgi:hypothetical protein